MVHDALALSDLDSAEDQGQKDKGLERETRASPLGAARIKWVRTISLNGAGFPQSGL